MLEPLQRYAESWCFALQDTELRFYEYKIDLFAFSEHYQRTAAVELKLHRWRRAFEQAAIYQLCADWVYIALPDTTCKRVDLPLLDQHGIGLISVSYDGCCERILDAKQSPVVVDEYRNIYINWLRQVR